MGKTSHKYTEDQIDAAKRMYLNYDTISSIVTNSSLTKHSILYYIPKWREERERAKSEIIDALSESKKNLMFSIAKNGLQILSRSMEELSKSTRVLTPKEMIGITNIIESLDKITKLDDGSATEIIGEIKPASIVEVRKLLKNDPFLEIEYEEVIDPVPSDS